jgi:hypothetical protein
MYRISTAHESIQPIVCKGFTIFQISQLNGWIGREALYAKIRNVRAAAPPNAAVERIAT